MRSMRLTLCALDNALPGSVDERHLRHLDW